MLDTLFHILMTLQVAYQSAIDFEVPVWHFRSWWG